MISVIVDIYADPKDNDKIIVSAECSKPFDLGSPSPTKSVHIQDRTEQLSTWISIAAKEAYNDYVSRLYS